jgi:predicted ATPase
LETFIVKTVKKEWPSVEDLASLRHEFKILRELTNVDGVIKAVSLESFGNGLALVLSDFEGVTLSNLLSQGEIPIDEILDITVDITRVLGLVHAQGVIHKDVKPSNIMYNRDLKRIQLFDFGISSLLSSESYHYNTANLVSVYRPQTAVNPMYTTDAGWQYTTGGRPAEKGYGAMVGTLAYMSPEQTGRMNRVVDYRSDFYSLGVTLFELATGRLPFQAAHRLEYVHCHMAKAPPRADEINPRVPQALGDVIAKLLSKNAEDRYQSAEGLIADLKMCMSCYVHKSHLTSGMIQSVNDEEESAAAAAAAAASQFVVGEMDQYSRFMLASEALRQADGGRTCLLKAFDRVVSDRTTARCRLRARLLGNGQVVDRARGAEADRCGREEGVSSAASSTSSRRGSSSLVVAFRDLLRHLLSEGREAVEIWRGKILEAVGSNGRLITDMLPELEKIIGKQPAVPELGPVEAENRFNRVFTQFVRLFCREEHPLALFLDDLQWADSTSLQLLSLIMCDGNMNYLLLIGAYRDNEVSSVHPLVATMNTFAEHKLPIHDIEVLPLSVFHISQLVQDTTRCQEEPARVIAELLHHKTAGNPFYVSQLLKTLHMEGHIAFSFEKGGWHWDADQLREQMSYSDNVVDLMVRQIQKLSADAQSVLKVAAALGDKFSLQVLSVATGKELRDTARDLWEALHAGLVLPMSQIYNFFVPSPAGVPEFSEDILEKMQEMASSCHYRFLHDRVQQAAYSLVAEADKEELHLIIGRRMLQNLPPAKVEENLHAIVNQINSGAKLLTDDKEREQMALLNLTLGRKARLATAYQTAAKHLDYAIALIADPVDYDLIYPEGLERGAEWAITSAAAHTSSCWQDERREVTMDIYNEAVRAHFLYADYDRAERLCSLVIRHANSVLEMVVVYEQQLQFYSNRHMLGDAIDLGHKALALLQQDLVKERPGLAFTDEELDKQPDMKDPRLLAVMRILAGLFAPAIVRDPVLYAQIPYTMVDVSNRYGTCPLSAFGYSFYGSVVVNDDPHQGLQAGKLALRLLDKYKAAELTSRTYALFYGMTANWHMPLHSLLEPLAYAKKAGLEMGDHEWAAHSEDILSEILVFCGESLEVIHAEVDMHWNAMVARGHTLQATYTNFWRRFLVKMKDPVWPKEYLLFGRMITDEQLLEEQLEAKELLIVLAGSLAIGIYAYYQKDYETAAAAFRTTDSAIAGRMVNQIMYRFYSPLALLQLARKEIRGSVKFNQYIEEVKKQQSIMRGIQKNAPMNYKHMYQLVKAEMWNVLGKHSKAMDFYDKAIAGAMANSFPLNEALGKELAGEFYCSRGKHRFGAEYLRDAYYAYIRYGAQPRVKQLESRLQQLSSSTPSIGFVPSTATETGTLPSPTVTGTIRTDASRALGTMTVRGKGDPSNDLSAVINISQTLFGTIELDALMAQLMANVMENTGADGCVLLLERDGQLFVEANSYRNGASKKRMTETNVRVKLPYEHYQEIPHRLVKTVWTSCESFVLDESDWRYNITGDTYMDKFAPKWVLCTPVMLLNKPLGVLYLENRCTNVKLRKDRFWLVTIISAQMGISLNNTYLFGKVMSKSEQLKVRRPDPCHVNVDGDAS